MTIISPALDLLARHPSKDVRDTAGQFIGAMSKHLGGRGVPYVVVIKDSVGGILRQRFPREVPADISDADLLKNFRAEHTILQRVTPKNLLNHEEVGEPLLRLSDALCMWEQGTASHHLLIALTGDGHALRLFDHSPREDYRIPDANLLQLFDRLA